MNTGSKETERGLRIGDLTSKRSKRRMGWGRNRGKEDEDERCGSKKKTNFT
jgi:hypothetical protein